MLTDIISVLILIALAVLFAWLTRRAWGSRHKILKWPALFFSGLLTLVLTLAVVSALIGFYKLNEPHNNPVVNIQVAGTAAQIARGERLAHICAGCHGPQKQLLLSGVNFITEYDFPPLGTFYAPNLTPSGNISDWSDGEVIRAIREGIHKNGRSLLLMPANDFRYMSDDDVQAMVAYLRSQPPTSGPTPDNEFNLPGAVFINLIDFRTAQQPVGHVSAPQPGTPQYGKYMVDVIGCQGCHGDQLQGKVYSGIGPPTGPNLTKIVPQWTEEQFMTFFNTGTLPDGGTVPILTLPSGRTEPAMPWPTVRAVATDDELKAMYAYLHRLSPVEDPAK